MATYKIDPLHSDIAFKVKHMMISTVTGHFNSYTANVKAMDDTFANAQIEVELDVNSITTKNEDRDGHLKSDDFFNAEKYPAMTFKSSSLKKVSGNKYTLTGDLTIRDVTKKVSFNVTYGGTAKDPYGNVKSGFKASGKINRFDYGLKWNTLTEAGGAMVGKDINITLNLEFAQKKA